MGRERLSSRVSKKRALYLSSLGCSFRYVVFMGFFYGNKAEQLHARNLMAPIILQVWPPAH